jgi:hypothetical protein
MSGNRVRDQWAEVSGDSGSISTQQGGSLQWMWLGDGRRPGLQVMGTTQLARRVDQMWPLGRGVVGVVVELALA